MRQALWNDKWALGLNIVLIAAYLLISSTIWIDPRIPESARSVPGAPFIFILVALPIVVLALVLDIAWLGWRIWRGVRTRSWTFWAPLALIFCAWTAAHLVNKIMLAPA